MTNMVYEASIYSRKISYKNFKGEEKTVELNFALDPLQLLATIAKFEPKQSRSGNPALRGKDAPISDEQQVKLIRDLASQAAGTPSDDGESWIPFENFGDSLVGKAFLTKLTSSDADRMEFATKVILDPFRAWVSFAENDTSNSPSEIAQLKQMFFQMENVFKAPAQKELTVEEKRAQLRAQMDALDSEGPAEGTQGNNVTPLP